MARANLRRMAAETARAEYQPQIRGVRRETGAQVRSINTMTPALTASLEHSSDALRHAGLSPRDLAIAETELAHRIGDVGAGAALQTRQVQQEGHGQIVDLLQSQGQAQKATLGTLLNEAAQRQQDIADEKRSEARDFRSDIRMEETLKRLGLGSYAEEGNGGLTPTQQRAATEDHHAAAHYAKEYVRAAKGGLADEDSGEEILPAGPHNWNDDQWNLFVDKVASKGVDVTVAQDAVQDIRDHFQRPAGNSPMDALKTVASVAAPALAPTSLQPIAQFAGALLGRR